MIKHVFGEKAEPLANVRVLLTPRQWTDTDLKIDAFLIEHGAPLSIHDAMLRYGRAMPQPGEEVLHAAPSRDMPTASSHRRPPHAENSRPEDGVEGPVALINEAEPDENWLHISPLGDFPHRLGLQKVNRVTTASLASQFNGLWQRFGRLFTGVPVYVGHPEVPRPGELPDHKAYGWVTKLEDRDNGLWGQVKWTPAGRTLIKDGHYKYASPYWSGVRESGIVIPTRLLSVALTNTPNLPVEAIENSLETANPPHAVGLNALDGPPWEPPVEQSRTLGLGSRRNEIYFHPSAHELRAAVQRLQEQGLSFEDAWTELRLQKPALFEGF